MKTLNSLALFVVGTLLAPASAFAVNIGPVPAVVACSNASNTMKVVVAREMMGLEILVLTVDGITTNLERKTDVFERAVGPVVAYQTSDLALAYDSRTNTANLDILSLLGTRSERDLSCEYNVLVDLSL